jgi:DNA-directed RNA polymerase omega subunit
MPETNETAEAGAGPLPEIDSRFRLVVVAALRSKQLLRGATPRIDANPLRRRNTSIALEEVKRGLVSYALSGGKQDGGEGTEPRRPS